jgi:GH15 family glucan-1,4-alpha-glucosidase
MHGDLAIRFDYGAIVPWVERTPTGIAAIAGPDALALTTTAPLVGEEFRTVSRFSVRAGERVPFVLTYHPSHRAAPVPIDAEAACAVATQWWRDWCARSDYRGDWSAAVCRSLVTLKALTFAPTGGIVAAPTTSLPEAIGGERNWDYRFCWLRDATFTLYALLVCGYTAEAHAWRDWLMRVAAGRPEDLCVVHGLGGERRLTELALDWLPGYRGSRPVRIGNAASMQRQLDVYGEVFDALHLARRSGLCGAAQGWNVQRALLRFLETAWTEPDRGIWEVRGPAQHFTHSKVMAWVAFDRAVKAVERFGLEGPVDRWRAVAAAIHRSVCAQGVDPAGGHFVQAYGSRALDASLLLLPLVGFVRADDPRMLRTVAAIERGLAVDGLVLRYRTDETDDGLAGGEGVFLPCSFWLADNYALVGRHVEARALFERLLGLANDVGLLAEEYDPHARRQLGNFPQALTHVALVNTARNLSPLAGGPSRDRGEAVAEGEPR